MMCEENTKNLDVIEISMCPKSKKDDCNDLELMISPASAKTPEDRDAVLRKASEIAIGTIEHTAKKIPLDYVNIGFRDWDCGGGDLVNFTGHESVINEFQKYFEKSKSPKLGLAHDYIDISF